MPDPGTGAYVQPSSRGHRRQVSCPAAEVPLQSKAAGHLSNKGNVCETRRNPKTVMLCYRSSGVKCWLGAQHEKRGCQSEFVFRKRQTDQGRPGEVRPWAAVTGTLTVPVIQAFSGTQLQAERAHSSKCTRTPRHHVSGCLLLSLPLSANPCKPSLGKLLPRRQENRPTDIP